ncbi:hypothetical protein PI124_g8802 [Phytophthora idaei]|nr:hypothetical protein PI125_g16699 [Phytophthora idaei]KAG3141232.1 hypothetical protein PI126_g15582 [Phytophthora idaei]KAG3246481.1 hypothetical protein PI124_g8802 [Phytophthora idaei]
MELEFCDKRLEVLLHCDNQSAIAVVACNGNTSRVRRMAKHARFINECTQRNELEMVYVPTADNIADVFTKALGPAEFERQRAHLNMEDVSEARVMVEASPDVQDDGDVEMPEV